MKRKESLLLMEILIMIAVFALAAGICLRIFAGAVAQSKENALLDRSVTGAQNAAGILIHNEGDFAAAAKLYGGTWDGECWTIPSDAGYVLTVTPTERGIPLLGTAEITVFRTDHSVMFTLPVAWQKTEAKHGT